MENNIYINEKRVKKLEKWKFFKRAGALAILGGMLLTGADVAINKREIPYTIIDNIRNPEVHAKYIQSLNETPNFTNSELYQIILNTNQNLSEITSLVINGPLNNEDLSELKYLRNLETLTITDTRINCEDIKYNQKLKNLYIYNSPVLFTENIPNTVQTLCINDSKIIIDLSVPYNTKNLVLNNTTFDKFLLRHPENLVYFNLETDSLLDMKCLEKCENLMYLYLLKTPNVSNPEILSKLPKLESLAIDDHSASWLTEKLFNKLPIESNETTARIKAEIIKLDNLAKEIIPNKNISIEEKIKRITLYILNNFEYDLDIYYNLEENYDLAVEMNEEPLKYVLNNQEIICINYTALFQALARRCGIETYQVFSYDHAWNYIKINDDYRYHDVTNLDTVAIVNHKVEDDFFFSGKITDATTQAMIEKGKEDQLAYYLYTKDETDPKLFENPIIKPDTSRYVLDNMGYISNEKELLNSRLDYNSDYLDSLVRKTIAGILSVEGLILLLHSNFLKKQKEQEDNNYSNEYTGYGYY